MTSPNLKPLNGLEPTKAVPIGGGKQHPTADGLIDKAHRNATDRGFVFVGSTMELVARPGPENNMTAIVLATVSFRSQYEPDWGVMTFTDMADANPTNCTSPNTAAAYPRMAATRALGRALAQALNVAEALAEEMVQNGGLVPGQPVAAPAYAAPAAVAPAGGYAAPAAAPGGVNFNGQAYLRANGNAITGFTKDTKGKQLTDPTIDVGSLQWMADKATLSDKVTVDAEFRNAALAEIQRRQGGAVPMAAAPAAPVATLPPAPVGAIPGVPAALPPAPGMAPTTPPPPMPGAVPAPAAAWAPSSADIQNLVNLGAPKGYDWPKLVQYTQTNFQNRTPQQLTKPEFDSVVTAFGGVPTP